MLRGWTGLSVTLSRSWNHGRRGRGCFSCGFSSLLLLPSPHSLHRVFVGLEFGFIPFVGTKVQPGTSSSVVLERPCHFTLAKPALFTCSRLNSSAALNTEGDTLVALAVPAGLCSAHPNTLALVVNTVTDVHLSQKTSAIKSIEMPGVTPFFPL